jgi:hypothetical protein
MLNKRKMIASFLSLLTLTCSQDLFAASGFQTSLEAGDLDGMISVFNQIVEEQKEINSRFGIGSQFTRSDHIPPAPKDGYAPIILVNSSGIDSSRIYFLGTGTAVGGSIQHFLKPDLTTGVCSISTPDVSNSVDSDISVPLSSLPKSGPDAYLIYLPQQIAGRCYLSIDNPLYLQTSSTEISPPSVGTPRDPTFYTLYQNFELTLDANYELWANVSNVDFFSLPMQVASRTYPSGNLYPTLDNLTATGMAPTTKRSTVLSTVSTDFQNLDQSPGAEWSKLFLPFYTDPYAVSGEPATTLRILSAKQSISFATNGFTDAGQPFGAFASDYLTNYSEGPVTGESYMQALGAYYAYGGGESLEMIIYPANESATTYTVTGVNGDDMLLNFETSTPGAPDFTVDLTKLTTFALLGGDVGVWDGDDVFNPPGVNVYNTEVAKLMSALFSAGMLPPRDSVVQPIDSQESYFVNYRSTYFANPTGFTDLGPWYNLYDYSLHNLMIKTGGYGLGYAYDYDDLLGLGGEMHVKIGFGPTVNPADPYYVVTLGIVDTIIPNPTTSFGPYQLKVNAIGAGKQPIKIYYSTTAGGSPTEVLQVPEGTDPQATLPTVYNYFIVEYNDDSTKQFKVYPNYQYVVPVGNSYTAAIVALSDGIDFIAASDSSFEISLPSLAP